MTSYVLLLSAEQDVLFLARRRDCFFQGFFIKRLLGKDFGFFLCVGRRNFFVIARVPNCIVYVGFTHAASHISDM